MNTKRYSLLILIIFTSSIVLTGCWNYYDIEKYSIVSGFAIDRNINGNNYLVTVEIIDFEMSGKEAKQVSKLVRSEGSTIMDAVRNIINATGKKLFWAHSNIVIISEEIAREGISAVLDLIFRDAEMREEMYVLISKENTAQEILEHESVKSELHSAEIEQMLQGQRGLAKAPHIKVYELIEEIEQEGLSAVLPAIIIEKNEQKYVPRIIGTAIFKSDKLIGFLDTNETKYLLFIKNEVNGGVLNLNEHSASKSDNVSLEILRTKTKLKPEYSNGKLTIKIEIKPEVALAEIESSEDYLKEKNMDMLKKHAEESLKSFVENLIKKVQDNYGSDIFGFGMHVKADMPSVWKEIESDWDNVFKKLNVNVNVDITIRNSALVSKTIKRGD